MASVPLRFASIKLEPAHRVRATFEDTARTPARVARLTVSGTAPGSRFQNAAGLGRRRRLDINLLYGRAELVRRCVESMLSNMAEVAGRFPRFIQHIESEIGESAK
jgi:hypothetical protein